MSDLVLAVTPSISGATSDDHLVSLWLHMKSNHTRRAYKADIDRFMSSVQKPLGSITVSDVQSFAESISDLADSSRARVLSSLKSLLSFGQRVGYLHFNVGAVVPLPKIKATLANRILQENQVWEMFFHETSERNRTILETLYFSGCRVSELTGLTCADVQANQEGGQLTLFGKGGKTRVVRVPEKLFSKLQLLKSDREGTEPLFVSRKHSGISAEQVHRIVSRAAKRAGIAGNVSAHWLRHAHASHSLNNGAPAHLVQATLGHSSLMTTSKYTHARPTDSSGLYLKG